jgi:hypothetical protein
MNLVCDTVEVSIILLPKLCSCREIVLIVSLELSGIAMTLTNISSIMQKNGTHPYMEVYELVAGNQADKGNLR